MTQSAWHQFMNTVGTVLHNADVFLRRGPEVRDVKVDAGSYRVSERRFQAQKKKLKQDT